MVSNWQIIPGEGLGGETPEGETYYLKALISYYVNGRYIETRTQAEEIIITPQPKIKLHYYVPHKVKAGQPFKIGVTAENTGYGFARNLVVDSGNFEITTNQAGLMTQFEILDTSFGSVEGNRFRLNMGDISPQSQVTDTGLSGG